MCAVEVFKNNALGNLFLRHINSASALSLESFVKDHINKGNTIRTDGWSGYAGLKVLGYDHQPIKLNKPEDASRKLPRVYKVFANLQSWIICTHRFVSKKHLQNYLNEFSTRFNSRHNPIEVFNDILKLTMNVKPRIGKDFMDVEKPYYPNPAERNEDSVTGKFLLGGFLVLVGSVALIGVISDLVKKQNGG